MTNCHFAEKHGVHPNEATTLYKYVKENCPNLLVDGLMTIGKYGYDTSLGPNPDFLTLKQCREQLCKELNLEPKEVNLSMGMSDDFEQAVRVYSFIDKY